MSNHTLMRAEMEIARLRELNAELLAALKDCMGWNPITSARWNEVVAKAEKLK